MQPRRPPSFSRPNSVTLDASGYGHCFVTCPGNVTWTVKRVSVSTNAEPPVPGSGAVTIQPTLTIYKDKAPNPSAFVAGSSSGNRDTARADEVLMPGESLCAEWIGTTDHAGLIATMVVAGTYTEG